MKPTLPPEWISEWVVDDGNNRLLWNDKAPTPNQVIDLLTQVLADQREKILELLVDDKFPAPENLEYMKVRNKLRAELRAKLNQLKET